MGDLEELFFTRNIPGKYSRWDEENDDLNLDTESMDFSEEECDLIDEQAPSDVYSSNAQRLLEADIPEEVRQSIMDERERKHRTGVKGVLADHKASQALKKAERLANVANRNKILTRIAEGTKIKAEAEENTEEQQVDKSDDDSDDDFMREFRAKRLNELKAQKAAPTFGFVKEILDSDFLDEVDKEDPRVFIIIHLYDTSVMPSVRMNRLLDEIALKMEEHKFLRMNSVSSCMPIDRVALPVLTIYKGGACIDTIAGIAVEFGEYFKKEDIEWLIESRISN